VPRYNFVAVADVIDHSTQTCLHGRISELSRKGCYVDTLNPLPLGTQLKVVISRDQGTFAATGKVIYVQETFGMGVAFVDTPADQLNILDSWLANRPPADAQKEFSRPAIEGLQAIREFAVESLQLCTKKTGRRFAPARRHFALLADLDRRLLIEHDHHVV